MLSTPLSDNSALGSPQKSKIDVIELSGDENYPEALLAKPAHRRRETGPKGLARLRSRAPPALQIKDEMADGRQSCILESDDEEGLVMLLWGVPNHL
jgi:hypothetical protein